MEQPKTLEEFVLEFFETKDLKPCPYNDYKDSNRLNLYNHIREQHPNSTFAAEIPFYELVMTELVNEYNLRMGETHFKVAFAIQCFYCNYVEKDNWFTFTDHVRRKHSSRLTYHLQTAEDMLQKRCNNLLFVKMAKIFTDLKLRNISPLEVVLKEAGKMKASLENATHRAPDFIPPPNKTLSISNSDQFSNLNREKLNKNSPRKTKLDELIQIEYNKFKELQKIPLTSKNTIAPSSSKKRKFKPEKNLLPEKICTPHKKKTNVTITLVPEKINIRQIPTINLPQPSNKMKIDSEKICTPKEDKTNVTITLVTKKIQTNTELLFVRHPSKIK